MSNRYRLRRLIRNLIKDKSWIKVTNWEWYDLFNNQHIEQNENIFCLDLDFCGYKMFRTNNLNHKSFSKYECVTHICFYAADCLCYNFYISDCFELERLEGECNYLITDGKHEIKIERLSARECKEKHLYIGELEND